MCYQLNYHLIIISSSQNHGAAKDTAADGNDRTNCRTPPALILGARRKKYTGWN